MTKIPSPYTRAVTPEQNAKRFKRQYAAWSKDPDTIKRHHDMDALFAAIKVLVELGEKDAAYELRILHDNHFRNRK